MAAVVCALPTYFGSFALVMGSASSLSNKKVKNLSILYPQFHVYIDKLILNLVHFYQSTRFS